MKKEFNEDLIKIGERIKKLRRTRDYCQESLAKALGVSVMTVSRIENGVTPMNILLLIRIADVLGITVEEILGERV